MKLTSKNTYYNVLNAEGGIRTPTSLRTLDPEPSVSASSTTSALAQSSRVNIYHRGELCQE